MTKTCWTLSQVPVWCARRISLRSTAIARSMSPHSSDETHIRSNAMRSHWHLRRYGEREFVRYGEREFVSRALCLLARLTNSRSPLCLLHEHISTSALHCNALIRYSIVQFNGLVCLRTRVYKCGRSLTHSNTPRSGCDAFKTIYLCKYVFFVYIHLVTVSG